ncbi:MAG: VOC family protein [Rhodobiaceae bacterium]|nr:VOC family protein [Rhodobiaceae bacterium]
MLDHVGLSVSDYSVSKAFYLAALKPLNYGLIMEVTEVGPFGGFGEDGKPDFWIEQGTPAPKLHVALVAKDRATVDAFYKAAMAAGAKDNGAPGLRPIYHEHYYGAFVLDPDGHNIEAVCHSPE